MLNDANYKKHVQVVRTQTEKRTKERKRKERNKVKLGEQNSYSYTASKKRERESLKSVKQVSKWRKFYGTNMKIMPRYSKN